MTANKIYTEINSCRLCSSQELKDVVDLGLQPPANSLRRNLDEILPTAPLKLVHCGACSGVQLTATVDPKYLFSQYVWVTGTSSTAREYSEYFANEVLKKTGTSNPFVVEMASNDGTFLKKFKEKGCSILGVDPAQNIAKKAEEDGIPTWAEFFNSAIAKKIIQQKSKANIVIARNVIPHVKEIHSIVEGLSELVEENGSVVIEFHYAKSIIKELHYDSIYHEHLFYFSLRSLSNLFSKYQLFPYDIFESPISGGSLVLFFSKKKNNQTEALKKFFEEEEKLGLNDYKTWKKFGEDSIQHAQNLKKIAAKYSQKHKLIGYGASARSSTMMNFAQVSNQEIDFIIDKNPLKQNHYTPGTNIKIISYEDGIKKMSNRSLLLLAWNFEKEIIRDIRKSGFKGEIIVPLPNEIRIQADGVTQ